jgi:hypothetical protein
MLNLFKEYPQQRILLKDAFHICAWEHGKLIVNIFFMSSLCFGPEIWAILPVIVAASRFFQH